MNSIVSPIPSPGAALVALVLPATDAAAGSAFEDILVAAMGVAPETTQSMLPTASSAQAVENASDGVVSANVSVASLPKQDEPQSPDASSFPPLWNPPQEPASDNHSEPNLSAPKEFHPLGQTRGKKENGAEESSDDASPSVPESTPDHAQQPIAPGIPVAVQAIEAHAAGKPAVAAAANAEGPKQNSVSAPVLDALGLRAQADESEEAFPRPPVQHMRAAMAYAEATVLTGEPIDTPRAKPVPETSVDPASEAASVLIAKPNLADLASTGTKAVSAAPSDESQTIESPAFAASTPHPTGDKTFAVQEAEDITPPPAPEDDTGTATTTISDEVTGTAQNEAPISTSPTSNDVKPSTTDQTKAPSSDASVTLAVNSSAFRMTASDRKEVSQSPEVPIPTEIAEAVQQGKAPDAPEKTAQATERPLPENKHADQYAKVQPNKPAIEHETPPSEDKHESKAAHDTLPASTRPLSVVDADKPAPQSSAPTHNPIMLAQAENAAAVPPATQAIPSIAAADTSAHLELRTIAGMPYVAEGMDELALRIAAKSSQGENEFTIRLDPPELGGIEVKLHLDAHGKSHANLAADLPQTLDLFQRDSAMLERTLKDAGIDLSGGLSFSLKGDGEPAGGRGMAGQTPFKHMEFAASEEASASSIPAAHIASEWGNSSRLDISV